MGAPVGAALPVAAPHPAIEGKMRVLCADVRGVTPGEMFAVGLSGCSHTVRIPFPAEPCKYITFKLVECPKCKRARESAA